MIPGFTRNWCQTRIVVSSNQSTWCHSVPNFEETWKSVVKKLMDVWDCLYNDYNLVNYNNEKVNAGKVN